MLDTWWLLRAADTEEAAVYHVEEQAEEEAECEEEGAREEQGGDWEAGELLVGEERK